MAFQGQTHRRHLATLLVTVCLLVLAALPPGLLAATAASPEGSPGALAPTASPAAPARRVSLQAVETATATGVPTPTPTTSGTASPSGTPTAMPTRPATATGTPTMPATPATSATPSPSPTGPTPTQSATGTPWPIGRTFVVNTTSDYDDLTDDLSQASLRKAIRLANLTPELDTIAFSLPGPDLTIRPLSPLPPVRYPAVIDGTTQPGHTGFPRVGLSGVDATDPGGAPVNGLTLYGGKTVKDLVINLFSGAGILLDSLDSSPGGNVLA